MIKYRYTYKTTAFELWQLSMYYTYGSMVGVCNLIFTVAVIALTATRWSTANGMWRLLLLFSCCLFPVIQPLLVYVKAARQAAGIRQETEVEFDDSGIHIKVGDQESDIGWKAIKRISKKPTMIVVFSDTTHGFVLTNRVLGKDREAFYDFAASKING